MSEYAIILEAQNKKITFKEPGRDHSRTVTLAGLYLINLKLQGLIRDGLQESHGDQGGVIYRLKASLFHKTKQGICQVLDEQLEWEKQKQAGYVGTFFSPDAGIIDSTTVAGRKYEISPSESSDEFDPHH